MGVNWRRRLIKILSVFINGYGAGFTVSLGSDYLLDPVNLNLFYIFSLPLLAGMVSIWPQLSKLVNEVGNAR